MGCPTCGLKMSTPALRCPRCWQSLPVGCSGGCWSCSRQDCSLLAKLARSA